MGLDFGLQRKRIDPGFAGAGWETLWQGRNCHEVRDLIFETLDTNITLDSNYIDVGIGTLTLIVKRLVKEVNYKELIHEDYTTDNTVKLLEAICGLADVLHTIAFDNVWEDEIPHYEYRFYNSF